jgi:hypothetical protein
VLAADHAGLFYRIAGAIHLAGGSIIDARIHTPQGWRRRFLVQDPLGRAQRRAPPAAAQGGIADALSNRVKLMPQLAARRWPPACGGLRRPADRDLRQQGLNRFTVVEVGARDRPALLARLAHILFDSRLVIHSAHIATFGERAVDTFYVTDILGQKDRRGRCSNLERLLDAAEDHGPSRVRPGPERDGSGLTWQESPLVNPRAPQYLAGRLLRGDARHGGPAFRPCGDRDAFTTIRARSASASARSARISFPVCSRCRHRSRSDPRSCAGAAGGPVETGRGLFSIRPTGAARARSVDPLCTLSASLDVLPRVPKDAGLRAG